VNEVVSSLTDGGISLSVSEIASILDAPRREAEAVLGEILNARGGVEFSTTGHTAADVALAAFGAGADLHGGTIDNTTVAAWLAEAMGLSFPVASPAEGAGATGDWRYHGEDGDIENDADRIDCGWTAGEADFLFA
jgi:alkaline phosphatase